MDNKIVSTTYVPLQPPYQIIKYTGDIAMQIGTLIVTIQKEGNVNGLGYEIETHSHPVVTYENKFKTEPNHQLTAYQFLEGAVWNFVEVKDVTTICLSNSRLPWQEFIDFLWRDVDRRISVAQPTIASYWSLEKLCGGVELPEAKHYVIHLELYNHDKIEGENIPVLRSRADDIFALNVEIGNDMITVLSNQIMNYFLIWLHNRPTDKSLSYSFETDDDRLRDFVSHLNGFSLSVEQPLNFNRDTISKVLKIIENFKDNGGDVTK